MSWNYRVIVFTTHPDNGEALDTHYYGIHEVYYDAKGNPNAYAIDPAPVFWDADDDPNTPHSILDRMRDALSKPVLRQQDFLKSAEKR